MMKKKPLVQALLAPFLAIMLLPSLCLAQPAQKLSPVQQWVPGEGRELLDQAPRPKTKPGNPFTLVQEQRIWTGLFSPSIFRPSLTEWTDLKSLRKSVLCYHGSVKCSARKTKQKA
jgi:hypothetical protein